MSSTTPPAADVRRGPASSVLFATAARALAGAARRHGLQAPGFRSPPRRSDADRALQRGPNGAPTVSVRVKGRPWAAVLADMIEGVVVANELGSPAADGARATLWAAVVAAGLVANEAPTDQQASVAPLRRTALHSRSAGASQAA